MLDASGWWFRPESCSASPGRAQKVESKSTNFMKFWNPSRWPQGLCGLGVQWFWVRGSGLTWTPGLQHLTYELGLMRTVVAALVCL